MDRSEFSNPGREYRGVTLWMLNDLLEPDEIERQLEGFAEAGWGAVITRTFNGLRTEYLSDSWHEVVGRIIDVANRFSMKVWLQAGHMPSAIPELQPGEQHQVLSTRPSPADVASDETLLFDAGGVSYLARRREHVLDLLDPVACRNYVESAYEAPMAGPYGNVMGDVVETVWVDEPHFNPPELPWSPGLSDRFRSRWGYDIVAELPSLFSETGDYRRVRHHYWRTVLEMLMESYFEEVRAWCDRHGVLFSGHLMGEDTLQAQISWSAASMPLYEYMGLPGVDHLTRALDWPAKRPFIMTPKQCSSAANQLGRDRALAEMYAVSSQGLSFTDRKRIAEWIMMLGINYRCYHGSFYSLRGRRKRIYAPHLSYQQPWWQANRVIADYFARFSFLMRQGKYCADVLVLHPVESAFCLYDSTNVENPYHRVHEPQAVRAYTDAFIELSDNLIKLHYGFEYGDETLIAKYGSVDGTTLSIGCASYSCVVLPPLITIRESTFDLLTKFRKFGGMIVAVEQYPDRIDGIIDARLDELFCDIPLVKNTMEATGGALSGGIARRIDVTVRHGDEPGDIWLHERSMDDGILIFVSNPGSKRIDLDVSARSGVFERWDCETGNVCLPPQRTVDGRSVTSLSLFPAGSAVFLLREEVADTTGIRALQTVRSTPLAADYRIARRTPNVLTLDSCRFAVEGEWSDPMPVTAVQEMLQNRGYRGKVKLSFEFLVDAVPRSISAVIEDAQEWTIAVNGTAISYSGAPYFVDRCFKPTDITSLVRKGGNTIEITRDFEPPVQPRFRLGGLFQTATGVELEAVYLIGDFGVFGTKSARPAKPGVSRFADRFTIGPVVERTSGGLLDDGFPFFAGSLELETELSLDAPAEDERVFLRFESVDSAAAKVGINGIRCGIVGWPPFEIELTDGVRQGSNTISVELLTSLRNMLGPSHRPSGDPDQVWSDGWTGRADSARRDTDLVAGDDWWKHRNDGTVFWTDDYLQIPFGLHGGVIDYRREI